MIDSLLILNWGTATIEAGDSYIDITFDKPYIVSSPTIVLTSTTTLYGGSVNAYVSDVTATNFRINVSDAGNSVEVHWRAIR